MSDNKQFLVVMFANDNHLSNVKTLQSILKQQYENVFLLVCNDATNNFQAERLLYNFWENKSEGIQQIFLAENHAPMGVCATLKEKLACTDAEYVMVVHSGEYLNEPETLEECAAAMEQNADAAALATHADVWFTDMSEIDETLTYDDDTPRYLRDCMFVYRYQALKKALENEEQGTFLWETAIDSITRQGGRVAKGQFSACKLTKASIEDEKNDVPQALGNERMLNIARKLQENKDADTVQYKVKAHQQAAPEVRKKQKIKNWLYKQSRFRSLLIYGILALLMIICAVLFLALVPGMGKVLGAVFAFAAVCAVLWCLGLAAFNLYFRKHPERLR